MKRPQPLAGEHAQDPFAAQLTMTIPLVMAESSDDPEESPHQHITATGKHQTVRSTGIEADPIHTVIVGSEQASHGLHQAEPDDSLPDQQDNNR